MALTRNSLVDEDVGSYLPNGQTNLAVVYLYCWPLEPSPLSTKLAQGLSLNHSHCHSQVTHRYRRSVVFDPDSWLDRRSESKFELLLLLDRGAMFVWKIVRGFGWGGGSSGLRRSRCLWNRIFYKKNIEFLFKNSRQRMAIWDLGGR